MTRLPRSAVVALVAVVVVVTAALVGLARWQEGREPAAAAPVPSPAEPWEQVEPGCSGASPRCRVPRSVEVDGRVLERTSLVVSPGYVTPGADTSRTQARVDLPRRAWLMTGVVDGSAEGYRVEVGDTSEEVAGDRPVLLRVGGPQAGVPVSITARGPRGEQGRQFVAVFAPADQGS